MPALSQTNVLFEPRKTPSNFFQQPTAIGARQAYFFVHTQK